MMRVFSTGRVRSKLGTHGVRRYLLDQWSDSTLPVNVFLIEHPDGLCLVDAGQSAAAAQPGYFPRWYPFFCLARFELSPGDEAAAQLSAAGYDPARVRWVVVTHMHTDHVGGLAAFTSAEVIVARDEWVQAQGLQGQLRGYLPQYWPNHIRPRLVEFTGPPIGPFPRSCDIASDGRLLMVPLPGHTQGHAAVIIRVDTARTYLCAGDAAHSAADLVTAAPKVADWCRRENITVLTSHDDSAARLIAGSPTIGASTHVDAPDDASALR